MYTIYVGHSSIGVANERHNLYVFSNKIYCYVFQLEVGIDYFFLSRLILELI